MAGEGKRFERKFKESAEKQGLLCIRLNDSSSSFSALRDSKTRFTATNPADFLIYSNPNLYFIENKSTRYKSISFERSAEDNGMIHLHQIRDLSNAALYDGVYAGFVFNFRVEEEGIPYSETTYYISIENFVDFLNATDRKSINENLILEYGGFKVEATQKRKLYEYNIEDMLKRASSKINYETGL